MPDIALEIHGRKTCIRASEQRLCNHLLQDAGQALAMFEKHRDEIDCVFSDGAMRGMRGEHLIAHPETLAIIKIHDDEWESAPDDEP